MLADLADVEARIGRPLDEGELLRVEGLLQEASVLVESHTGREFADPVPDSVSLVVSRMVARVLEAPAESLSADSTSYTAGPFNKSVHFSQGGSGGSPWLTAVDKKILARFTRRRGGLFSVEMG